MCSTNHIEVTNADTHPQLLLQFSLKFAAWYLRDCLTARLKPLENPRVKPGWVPMSAIVQSSISSCAHLVLPTIGCGSTYLLRRVLP